jgi:hypothetical protein
MPCQETPDESAITRVDTKWTFYALLPGIGTVNITQELSAWQIARAQ